MNRCGYKFVCKFVLSAGHLGTNQCTAKPAHQQARRISPESAQLVVWTEIPSHIIYEIGAHFLKFRPVPKIVIY
jgi:hypothetical protein